MGECVVWCLRGRVFSCLWVVVLLYSFLVLLYRRAESKGKKKGKTESHLVAACKVEFQPFIHPYSQLTFENEKKNGANREENVVSLHLLLKKQWWCRLSLSIFYTRYSIGPPTRNCQIWSKDDRRDGTPTP